MTMPSFNLSLRYRFIVGANPMQADIGAPGEVDVFRFEVPSFGPYTLLTTGSSDTFTLFWPQ